MILNSKRPRLLVVEDEIITARDLQDTLEELGYDVPGIAASGDRALDLASHLQPDLVLMDVNLGDAMRDGVDLASEMRDRWGLPVIYLTAYADAATLARAGVTAPLGYLTKPFERRELHATIQMALVKLEMDEELRQSENWYSASLASIGDGVIATDTAGQITFMNPEAETLTGWSNEEAVGEMMDDVFALFEKSTGLAQPGLAARVLRGECSTSLKEGTVLRSRTGRFFSVDDRTAPILDPGDGHVLGVVTVFRDVSEKQRAAAELERVQRLESLGTLAGGLAHDLNNILGIVAGNVSQAVCGGASPGDAGACPRHRRNGPVPRSGRDQPIPDLLQRRRTPPPDHRSAPATHRGSRAGLRERRNRPPRDRAPFGNRARPLDRRSG